MTVGFSVTENLQVGDGAPLLVLAGPCVIEDLELCMQVAADCKQTCGELGLGYVFKASFDKANRTSAESYRGPGLKEGLSILRRVKQELDVPVVTDVHETAQVEAVADIVDILQIPAFLCRQTDLLIAAGRTGRVVNVKKGQFMAPAAMQAAVEKVQSTGNQRVMLTERGSSFGYGNLVVDFRGLAIMRGLGVPVIFDATHSVQLPGGLGSASGGEREYAPLLLRAATAVGVDGYFVETHPKPEKALCDGPNSLPLSEMREILETGKAIDELVRRQS